MGADGDGVKTGEFSGESNVELKIVWKIATQILHERNRQKFDGNKL